jgi:hypothetical protein
MTSTEAIRVLPFDGKMESFKMRSSQFLALALKTKYIEILNGKRSVPTEDANLDETKDADKPMMMARRANAEA